MCKNKSCTIQKIVFNGGALHSRKAPEIRYRIYNICRCVSCHSNSGVLTFICLYMWRGRNTVEWHHWTSQLQWHIIYSKHWKSCRVFESCSHVHPFVKGNSLLVMNECNWIFVSNCFVFQTCDFACAHSWASHHWSAMLWKGQHFTTRQCKRWNKKIVEH